MSKQSFFSFTLLLVALGFSGWLFYTNNISKMTVAHNHAKTPDAFMVNASYLSFNAAGKLGNSFQIARMMHFSNNQSLFTKPALVIYGENKEPWHIMANYGQSQMGIQEVHLWNDVVIHRPAGIKDHEMTITTNSLTIFPQIQSALTNQAITISQPGITVNSTGLRANLKKGEIELLSKEKATYVSN